MASQNKVVKVEEKVERRKREREREKEPKDDKMRVRRYYFSSVWLLRKYKRIINVLSFQSFLFPPYFPSKILVLLTFHSVSIVFTLEVMTSLFFFFKIF